MSEQQRQRLEYLESIEFPTPFEFDELRALLAKQTDEFIRQQRQAEAVMAPHILEVAQAEQARAAAGGGVYGGGYCIAGQAPVIVGYVKPAAETDAQRADRLAQEVGRLTYELRNAREALRTVQLGPALPKGCDDRVEVPYGSETAVVAYSAETWDRDDGSTFTELIADSVLIGGQWVPVCELGGFGEALQNGLAAAVEAEAE